MQNKKSLLFASSALILSALAGCGQTTNTRIYFWTGFGGAVNAVLEPLIAEYEAANPGVDIFYEAKGGYDNLKQAIDLSVSNEKYPHVANGYPDHFASYINANIMLPLDSYIESTTNGVDLTDFFSDYLKENQELVYKKVDGVVDKNQPYTVGLPFNKSTEVMVINKSFFEVMTHLDPTVKVPETWDELGTIGAKIKQLAETNGFFGKVVVRDGNGGYTTANRPATKSDAFAKTVMFDFTLVTKENFRPFNWDSEDNFFITLVRQFGGTYTSVGDNIRQGRIHFNSPEVIAGLNKIKGLYDAGIVGIPQSYGESLFGSVPFRQGKLVMTISSTAGVKENIPNNFVDYPFEVGVNPIPYENAARKFVISQGTNLALFDRGSAEEKAIGWDFIKFLTVERNDYFGLNTGYFPVTKSAQDGELYSDFLAGDPEELNYTPGQKVVQDTAIMNTGIYMDAAADWTKFTDPGFVGSSEVRTEVSLILGKIFYEGKTAEQALNEAYNALSKYVPK